MAQLKIDLVVDDKGSLVVEGFGSKVDRVMWSSRASVRSFGTELKVAGAATTAMLTTLGLVGNKVVGIADDYTLYKNQLKLVTDSSSQLADVQEQLYEISLDTHQAFGDSVTMFARFSRATEDAGFSQQEMLTVTQAVNEAIIVSGATSTEASAAIIQLSQGMAAGTLRGEELNSVLDQTPRVAKMIADGLGVTRGELKELGAQGKLTTELVTKALLSQAETVNKEFKQMSTAAGQSWKDVKTVFNTIVFGSTEAAGVTSTLSGEIQDFVTFLRDNRPQIESFFAAGVTGVSEFSQGVFAFGREAVPYLETTVDILGGIYDQANRLSELGGPSMGEWGIIGYVLLRGGPQAAAVTAALITINDLLTQYGLNIGSLVEYSREFGQAVGNMLDVIQGKRDWNTGETIVGRSAEHIRQEIASIEATIAEAGDPVGEFFRKLFTGSEQSAAQIASLDALGQRLERLRSELEGVAAPVEDSGGILEPEWEGPAPAFDRSTEAAGEFKQSLVQLKPAVSGLKKELTGLETVNQQFLDTGKQIGVELPAYLQTASGEMDVLTANIVDTSDQAQQSTDKMVDYWKSFSERSKSEVHSLVYDNITDFESLEDAARDLGDAVVRIFADMVARILANWAASGIMELFSSGSLSGFSLGNLFGSGSGGGLSFGNVLSGASAVKSGSNLLGGSSGGGLGWFSGPTSGGALNSAGNLATYGSSAYSAWSTGVGTASSWYAGMQAAEMGVNAGTQLALIEGTYGAAQSGAAAGAAQAVAETTTSTAAGGAAGISGGVAGLGVFGAFMAGVMALDAIGHNSGYDRETIPTGVGNRVLGGVVDPNQDSIISLPEMYRDLGVNVDHIREYAEAISYSGDRASEAGSLLMNTSQATELLEQSLDRAGLELEVMAFQFGDATAQMALALDGEVESTIAFIDTLTGYNLSIDEAARLNILATQAADGSAVAFDTLYSSLLGLTGNAEEAKVALLGMVNAVSTLSSTPLSIDVAVSASGSGQAAIANTSVLEATTAFDPFWLDRSKVQESYASGGISAAGVFSRSTLLAGPDGRIRQIAEAGQPEAVTPLRHPQQISAIEDKVDQLLAGGTGQPVVVSFSGDASWLRQFVRVEADQLRVEVNDADLDPLQRAVY